MNDPQYVEDPPKSYIRVRRFLKRLKSEGFKIEGHSPKNIVVVSHYVTILNSLLQYARVMEANSPIHFCSLSIIKLKRIRFPDFIESDRAKLLQ